jgi:hypothetical protein
MQLIDPNHPFYRPLWVRLLVAGVCFAWAAAEAYNQQPTWAMIVGALGAYAAYKLLLTFNPQAPENQEPPESQKIPAVDREEGDAEASPDDRPI